MLVVVDIGSDITSRDLLDTRLMGILTPRPGEVIREFQSRCAQSLFTSSHQSHAAHRADRQHMTPSITQNLLHPGLEALQHMPEADFYAALPALRRECGDRAVLRAIHIYDENRRVQEQIAALRRNDFHSTSASIYMLTSFILFTSSHQSHAAHRADRQHE